MTLAAGVAQAISGVELLRLVCVEVKQNIANFVSSGRSQPNRSGETAPRV